MTTQNFASGDSATDAIQAHHDEGSLVRLQIPRALEFVPMARIVVAGYATRLGFDIDEVEDSRIAVDELTSLLVETGDGHDIEVTMRSHDMSLVVEGRCACAARQASAESSVALDAITEQILAAVVDKYELGITDNTVWFSSSRRRADG